MSRRAMMAGSLAAAIAATGTQAADPVIEFRQYKIAPGKRDVFIALFEREFVHSQEALGIRLVGQFRDLDDSDRFIWIREFPTMAGRAAALNQFYTGPVWHAHRDAANAMLDDNDNVLLLKPSGEGLGFGPSARRAPALDEAAFLVATIHYLWKAPGDRFAPFFESKGRAALASAGAHVLGSYVVDGRPNEFPRLPVRQGEKLFMWFTRVASMAAYHRAMTALRGDAGVRRDTQMIMPDLEERPAQVLRLRPTPFSRL